MKRPLLFVIFLFVAITCCYSQNSRTDKIFYDGFYIAKTGSITAAKVDFYTYFRFYKDGSVYLQAVTSNDAQAVSKFFGRYKKFSQKGTYQIKDKSISIQMNNKESTDSQLEGLQEIIYKGTIKSANQLCLVKNNESKENCFDFSKVLDTTKFNYSKIKLDIKLPGDWKIKQVIENTNQVFLTNEDSTDIGISIFQASKLPGYKETQSDFETAYVFYDWDSKYMKDELKMKVKKVSENKGKAFIIWNAKDIDNDNYHLFGKHKDLLYNIMIFDSKMPLKQQLSYLETLYDLNKE